MALAFLRSVQDAILQTIDDDPQHPDAPRHFRALVRWALVLTVAATVLWLFRQRTFFLGDGYLVLRTLPVAAASGDVPASFPTAPLSGFLATMLYRGLLAAGVQEPALVAWRMLSVASGVAAIPLIAGLARAMFRERKERIVATVLLACSGSAMLFFGYVETYAPAFAVMIAFIGMLLRVRRGESGLLQAVVLFVVLVLLHVGMVILLPGLVGVGYRAVRRDGWGAAAKALAGGVAAAGVILLLISYGPARLLATAVRDGSSFLPLFRPDGWNEAYGLFSLWHGVDLVNLHFLISPYTLVLTGGLVAGAFLPARFRPDGLFFWLSLAVPALLWLFVNNFELGMSRDWDLASPFVFVVGVAGLAAWSSMAVAADDRRRGLVVMAAVTAVHTAGWVGVNAAAGPSIGRFDTLLDFRTLSPRAMAIAIEEVGGYRRERGDMEGAVDAYARLVLLDSTNARRWTLLAGAQAVLGDTPGAQGSYERAAALGSRDPEVFVNLGIILYNQGDPAAATARLREAVACDTLDPAAAFTLGRMMLEGLRDPAGALPWFERTVHLDPAHTQARDLAERCRKAVPAVEPHPHRME